MPSRLRLWSYRFLVASVLNTTVAILAFWLGMTTPCREDGVPGLLCVGLLLSFVTWLSVAASSATGVVAWVLGAGVVFWVVPASFALVALTLLAFWTF